MLMRKLQDVTDLLPSSPLSKAVSAIAGGLLMVEPELVLGLAAVIALNTTMSIWYSFRTDDRTASLVLYWLVMRVLVYIVTLAAIIVLSNMLAVDTLRRLAFGAIAGWEVAVTLGLGARVSPQFAPIYERIMRVVDAHTPLNADVEDIDGAIDEQRSQDSNPKTAGGDAHG